MNTPAGTPDAGDQKRPLTPAEHSIVKLQLIQCIEKGAFEDAEAILAKYKARYSGDAEVGMIEAALYIQQGQEIRAVQALQEILRVNPREVNVLVMLAELLERAGRYTEASEVLTCAGELATSDQQERIAAVWARIDSQGTNGLWAATGS